MSITAFPVLARILSDRGLTQTRLGHLSIACAAFDDVTGWTMLASLAITIPAIALAFYVGTDFMPRLDEGAFLIQTVLPPDSARLAGAIDVPIQSLCPGQRISHSELPVSPVVTAIVLQAIGPGPMRPPRPAVCRA
jgi:hypothetical protein